MARAIAEWTAEMKLVAPCYAGAKAKSGEGNRQRGASKDRGSGVTEPRIASKIESKYEWSIVYV
jgi:hypothetical protein